MPQKTPVIHGVDPAIVEFVFTCIDSLKREEIIKLLVSERGMTNLEADQLCIRVQNSIEDYKQSPEWRMDMAGEAKRKMFFGMLWFVGGLIATFVSYSAASSGGTYFIFGGAVVFGFIDIIIGLFRWLKYRTDSPAESVSPAYPDTKDTYAKSVNVPSLTGIAPSTVHYPVSMAKMVLPDKSEISLKEAERSLGRNDFNNCLSSITLHYISRQHCLIKGENGRYLIEDHNSANGTKLNGVDIKRKGWQELRDGDQIDLAGVEIFTFRAF